MKVKELVKVLASFDQNAQVLVSSDEELNTLFEGFEVAVLENEDKNISEVVVYGLSGKERQEVY